MAVRSEASRRAVLETTMNLLDERQPGALTVQKLSIERIARDSGVSKTTIYRWWSNKVALVIDTFLDNHIAQTPVLKDVPALQALREHLGSVATVYGGREGGLMAQLIAECQYDSSAMVAFKEKFYDQRLQTATSIIERAVAEGVVRDDVEPQDIAKLLYAPLYFRLLFADGPLDSAAASEILDTVLDGIRRQ